jgi:translation elongation factor EF-G
MEDEQLRGITMRASAISLLYEERKRKLGIGNSGGGGEASGGDDKSGGGGGGGGEEEVAAPPEQKKKYLINLIDSPGHIDFCRLAME